MYRYSPAVKGNTGQNSENKTRRSAWLPVFFWAVLAAVLWAAVAYAGYYLVFQHVERSVRTVQETNDLNVKALESRLDTLAGQLQEINSSLGNTGRTLSSSGSTQKDLNDKIQQLDSQMKELEKSLKILQEAP